MEEKNNSGNLKNRLISVLKKKPGKENDSGNLKDRLISVFKNKKTKKIVLMVIVLLLVFVLASDSTLELRVMDSINSNNTESNYYREYGPEKYMEKMYISENGGLVSEVSIHEMWEKDDRYRRFLPNEDALAYFLNAQLVSQYPYIENLPDDELNGTIKFYRNDSTKAMKYVKKDKLNKLVESYNNGNSSDLKEALNSFTINESGSIEIAYLLEDYYHAETDCPEARSTAAEATGSSSLTRTINRLQTTTLSYTSYVRNYILPFNLLWSIIIIGNGTKDNAGSSINFAHLLASMAYDGKMDLRIEDNESITTNTDLYTFDKEKDYKGKIEGTLTKIVTELNDDRGTSRYSSNENNLSTDVNETETLKSYKYKYEEKHTVNSPALNLKKVESWIAKYNSTAAYEKNKDSTGNGNNGVSLDSKEGFDKKELSADDFNKIPNNVFRYLKTSVRDHHSIGADYATTEEVGDSKIITYYTERYTGSVQTTINYRNIKLKNTVVTETSGFLNGDVSSSAINDKIIKLFKDYKFYDLTSQLGKTSYKYFIRAVSLNEDTANMVDVLNYTFNQVYDTDVYYNGEEEFSSLFDGIYGSSMQSVGFANDFTISTQMSDSRLVISDNETLKKIITSTYSGKAQKNLLGVLNNGTFLKLQNDYHVNAVFAIAVCNIESGCGTGWAAIPSWTYNWMSMTGSYNGKTYRNPNSSNKRTWRVYSSFDESILDFGNMIANGSYYFTQGKYSVEDIAPTYCDKAWGDDVVSQMKEMYASVGIDVGNGQEPENVNDGDGYTKIFTANGRSYKEFRQNDKTSTYYNHSYSSGNVSSSGCGPTSSAIVVSGYGKGYNPGTLIDAASAKYNQRYFVASPDSTGKMLKAAGLTYKTDYTLSTENMKQHLLTGRPIVLSVNNGLNSKFTSGTHYIAILDIKNDQVYVSNPAIGRASGWVDIDDVHACNKSSDRVAFLIENN